MTTKTAVIVGMGQLGRTLGEGLLMCGKTVTPILRGSAIDATVNPQTVIVATGEDDLPGALDMLPRKWKVEPTVVLLQNELLPPQWITQGVANPTVFVVWFERKPGKPITPLLPSIVYGPQQDVIKCAMDSLAIPCEIASGNTAMLTELIAKNAYIWTVNIAGLDVGSVTTGALLTDHASLVEALIEESIAVQEAIIGQNFDALDITRRIKQALTADPNHGAGGRSAKRRLERFLAYAEDVGVKVPQAYMIGKRQRISARH